MKLVLSGCNVLFKTENQLKTKLTYSFISIQFVVISGVSLKQDNADVFVVDLSFVPKKKELEKGIFGKDIVKHKEVITYICQ